jgi:glutamyl aminopeptidase
MYDPRNTMPEYLKQAISRLAEANDIPFQYYISKGGTDAAKAKDMLSGVVNTTIGLPARYIHGPAAIFDIGDLKAAHQMLYTFLTSLNPTIIQQLKEGQFDVFPATK